MIALKRKMRKGEKEGLRKKQEHSKSSVSNSYSASDEEDEDVGTMPQKSTKKIWFTF